MKKFFRKVYDKIDTDHSGSLDKNELEAAIEKLAKAVDGISELPFTEQQVMMMPLIAEYLEREAAAMLSCVAQDPPGKPESQTLAQGMSKSGWWAGDRNLDGHVRSTRFQP